MKERPMRWVICLAMMLGTAAPAFAADAWGKLMISFRLFLTFYKCPSNCPSGRSGMAALRGRRTRSAARRLMTTFGLLASLLSPAFAADYDLPILRGSQTPLPVAPATTVGPATFTRWSGLYFGGVVSYTTTSADFINTTAPLIHFSLRSTTLEQQVAPSGIAVLGRGSDVGFGGGGFFGYNTQWQDLILGVEATYNHTNLNTTAASSAIARIFPSLNNEVALSATGRLDLTDYAEARFRAGYIVGNLLPYGFMGVAVGRASYSVTTLADVAQFTPSGAPFLVPNYTCIGTGGGVTLNAAGLCQDFPFSNSVGQNNALLWGFSVGAGLDWALTQHFFLRGEFEFVQFAPISAINLALFSGRVGAGYKF
jgi:opacity protein-like surface antigen